jgi:hypothetical protein
MRGIIIIKYNLKHFQFSLNIFNQKINITLRIPEQQQIRFRKETKPKSTITVNYTDNLPQQSKELKPCHDLSRSLSQIEKENKVNI